MTPVHGEAWLWLRSAAEGGPVKLGEAPAPDVPDATASLHVTDDEDEARRWHASLLRGERP